MTGLDPAKKTPGADQLAEVAPHPDVPVLGPMTGSWSRSLPDDTWYWSDEMYVIHGFAPGEVVPTTELVLRHKHPADLERSRRLVQTAAELGTPFSNPHRIVDAHGRVHDVLSVGRGFTDADGELVEVNGYTVDLTATQREEVQPAVEAALRGAMEHRGVIEQAKGGLMAAFRLDADGAFEMLRAISNRENIKLHDLAHRLVDELGRLEPSHESETAMHELLVRVARTTHPPE